MNKLTRIISVVAASALILNTGITDAFAAGREAADGNVAAAYSAGEKISGFTVTAVEDFHSFDAKVYVFEHDKTGGRVVFIKNDDPNRYFMLEFDTKAEDDKGCAHVLEHSVMSGSGAYPSRSLSNAIADRSCITYMNAFTKNASTLYPVASLSEKQLLAMAGYYTDLCFDPMILRDEDIFRSEGWRFALEGTDGNITINGTVYSEMSGRYSADQEAMAKAVGMLYPNCPSSFIAGGIPQDILTLTYDEVKDYYKRYYHPSNAVAYLYGDIEDASAFLAVLDGRFSRYERKDADTREKGQELSEERTPVYMERKYDFPASKSSEADGACSMEFAIDMGKLSDEQLVGLYAFTRSCDMEYSTPVLTLGSLFPGSSFGFAIIPDDGNVIFTVSAQGMREDEAPMFRAGVLRILKDMSANGLRGRELENVRRSLETEARLMREGSGAALDMLMGMANYGSGGRDILFYMHLRDMLGDMKWFDNDLVKTVSSALTGAAKSSMAVVVPRPGLLEEYRDMIKASLDKMGSSMTDSDRKKLADDTERIVSKAADDPGASLDGLNVATVSDLPDELPEYKVSDTTDKKGVRRVGAYTSTEGIEVTMLYLDASAIPQDMLEYLALYVDLVNGRFIPTGGHDQGELADLINDSSIRGQGISLTVTSLADDYRPYVTVIFMSSPEMTAKAYDLAYERLFESSFDDPALIREGISSVRKVTRENIENNPLQTAHLAACSSEGEGAAYYENTHYIKYYDFLTDLEKNIGGDYKNICARLGEVASLLKNSDGCVIGYVLPENEEASYLQAADGFVDKLDNSPKTKAEYDFEKYQYPLGIKTGTSVAYNVLSSTDITKYGIKEDDAATTLALTIITERYLHANTRDRYGAYTCSFMENYPFVTFYTSRDPVIKETYDAFAGMKNAWKEIRKKITQKELDEYIMRLYSQEMVSDGDCGDAASLVADIVEGRGENAKSLRCSRLKNIRVSDLEKYDTLFEKIADEGVKVSAGPADLSEGNEDMFGTVIDPFAK